MIPCCFSSRLRVKNFKQVFSAVDRLSLFDQRINSIMSESVDLNRSASIERTALKSTIHNWPSAFGIVLTIFLCCSPVEAVINQPPIANSGIDQGVEVGGTVHLDGQLSQDSDGNLKSYRWSQIKGQKVKLNNSKSAVASFVAPAAMPKKSSASTLIFRLTVTDNKNKKASDTVAINLVPCVAPKTMVNNICQLPTHNCTPPSVWQDGACRTPAVVVCNWPEVVQNQVCAIPSVSRAINDTGVVRCYDMDNRPIGCPVSIFPGQDAEFGRDAWFYDDRDGDAGFSFTKIDANGAELPLEATAWACVKDNVTGLVWEQKATDGGLRDVNNLYSHYGPDYNPSAQYQSASDALGYVNAVNQLGLCGAGDWRIPTVEELQGIVDFGIGYPGPTIDKRFFPATANYEYWTSADYPADSSQGWVVYFEDGRIFRDQRQQRYRLRLVRDSQLQASQ